MLAFSRLLDRVVGALGPLGSLAIIAVALLSVVEIFRRYVLNDPSVWATDLVIATAAVVYALAGPYAYRERRHIEITVFSDRLTGRWRAASELLKSIVGIGYVGALLYGSIQMAATSVSASERTGTAWDVPAPQVIKVVLVVAVAIFLILIVRRLAETVRAIASGAPLSHADGSDANPGDADGSAR